MAESEQGADRARHAFVRRQVQQQRGRHQAEAGAEREVGHRLAREHFRAGRFFPAHEAWETAWKQSRDTEDHELFKGLSQLGAGYVHLLRGNAHGAATLLRRAGGRIGRYPAGRLEIDTAVVAEHARRDADAVERGEIVPGPEARFTPPLV